MSSIHLSGREVRGIQSGALTLLRRVAKLNRYVMDPGGPEGAAKEALRATAIEAALKISPFQVEGRLLGKEKWAPSCSEGVYQIVYAADGRWGSPSPGGNIVYRGWTAGITDKAFPDWALRSGEWVGRKYFQAFRSSAHMPKWAARITLGITAVSVKHVQDITDDEIRAEGFAEEAADVHQRATAVHYSMPLLRYLYASEWDRSHRHARWDENPWTYGVRVELLHNGGVL